MDEFADFCCNPGLADFGCCFVWDVFFGCILKGSLEDVPELLCSCCVLWLYHCWTEVHFLQAGPVCFSIDRDFILSLFLLGGIDDELTVWDVVIWETWYDFCPGDELWAVRQVQIQGVILSSGFPYQLIKSWKSWWRPGLGAVDLRVGVVDYQSHPGKLKSLPMRRWALGSFLKWLSKFSQTGFISNTGPVVGTQ